MNSLTQISLSSDSQSSVTLCQSFFDEIAKGRGASVSDIDRHVSYAAGHVTKMAGYLASQDWQMAINNLQQRQIKIIYIGAALLVSFFVIPLLWASYALWRNHHFSSACAAMKPLAVKGAIAEIVQQIAIFDVREQMLSTILNSSRRVEEKQALAGPLLEKMEHIRTHVQLSYQRALLLAKQYGQTHKILDAQQETLQHLDNACILNATLIQSLEKITPDQISRAEVGASDTKKKLANGYPVALGFTGISNIGGSCYFASVLEAIRFNPVLRHLLTRVLPTKKKKDGIYIAVKQYEMKQDLQKKLLGLVEKLDQGSCIETADIMAVLKLMSELGANFAKKTMINVAHQGDSFGVLSWILETLQFETEQTAQGVHSPSMLAPLVCETRELVDNARELKPGHGLTQSTVLTSCTHQESILHISLASSVITSVDQELQIVADPILNNPETALLQQASLEGKPVISGYHLPVSHPLTKQLAPYLHVPFTKATAPINPLVVKKERQDYLAGRVIECSRFQNRPALLMLKFGRYHYLSDGQMSRLGGAINIPLHMDLTKAMAGTGSAQYELSSMVVHAGGLHGGHYQMFQRLDDGTWINCNDSQISMAEGFDPSTQEGSYLLFYRQVEQG